ncbi:MAG: APC family permease, partial [Chloroflexi bacterium]|nr:APC family permease [Chloroflexota bacterium]
SFWGFQEAWWSWLVSFVDMGIYPVLFGAYGSAVFRDVTGVDWFVSDAGRWMLATVLIWTVVGANLLGARVAGWLAGVAGVLVVTPFIAMAWMAVEGFSSFDAVVGSWSGGPPSGQGTAGALGAGLFLVMWNYQGWDGVATVNGEVRRPGRTIPVALGIVVVLSMLTYLLPVLAALTVTSDPAAWGEGAFPALAGAIGGEGLRFAVAVGAVIGVAGLFNANMLSNSRIPMALGEDHYLPPLLAKANARTGAPTASLILSGVLCEPRIIRPFRVPGGIPGIALVTALPMILLGLAIVKEVADGGADVLGISAAVLATGPVAWFGLTIAFKRGRPNRPVPVDLEGMVRHGAYDPTMAWTPRMPPSFRVGTTLAERAGARVPVHRRGGIVSQVEA